MDTHKYLRTHTRVVEKHRSNHLVSPGNAFRYRKRRQQMELRHTQRRELLKAYRADPENPELKRQYLSR